MVVIEPDVTAIQVSRCKHVNSLTNSNFEAQQETDAVELREEKKKP